MYNSGAIPGVVALADFDSQDFHPLSADFWLGCLRLGIERGAGSVGFPVGPARSVVGHFFGRRAPCKLATEQRYRDGPRRLAQVFHRQLRSWPTAARDHEMSEAGSEGLGLG